MVEGEKMSKSLGNFYTVHDLLDEFPGEAIRLALLKTHYRKPLDFTKEGLHEAKQELDTLYRALLTLEGVEATKENPSKGVLDALNDDLNMPLALKHMRECRNTIAHGDERSPRIKGELMATANLLGLLQHDPKDWFKGKSRRSEDGLCDVEIDTLIAQRKQARADKDFQASDRIRDELTSHGIVLEDGANGTTWRRS